MLHPGGGAFISLAFTQWANAVRIPVFGVLKGPPTYVASPVHISSSVGYAHPPEIARNVLEYLTAHHFQFVDSAVMPGFLGGGGEGFTNSDALRREGGRESHEIYGQVLDLDIGPDPYDPDVYPIGWGAATKFSKRLAVLWITCDVNRVRANDVDVILPP